jgi:GT2 family glycosyltransferase
MSPQPRVVRNDWSSLAVPETGQWQPSLTVTVVIPAFNAQRSLDLLLAALSRQSYPAELMDVVVVDDGSDPPLSLPPVRPPRTRLVWAPDHSDRRGVASACNVGIGQSTGDIVLRLDADMVPYPEHVEAHARWHHAVAYAVTLGSKRFVDDDADWPTPSELGDTVAIDTLFDPDLTEPHHYVEKIIRDSNGLRAADHLGFLAHVGATVAMRRTLLASVGGFDEGLLRGEDTELGYRLAQAGAVFVPEPAAKAWHLGRSGMMRRDTDLRRYSRPFLADRMPHPRWLRRAGGSQWAVPLVTVVVHADGGSLETVRAVVDAVLRSEERDLRVVLVGAWSGIREDSRSPLEAPDLDVALVRATYRSDGRVELVTTPPETPFPSPYLLNLAATAMLEPRAITRLIDECERRQVGLVRVAGDRGGAAVELWRTAAIGRSAWVRQPGESLPDVVRQTHGIAEVSPARVGVRQDAGAMTSGRWWRSAISDWSVGATVEVGGVRSWLRATAAVPVMVARQVRRRIRRLQP